MSKKINFSDLAASSTTPVLGNISATDLVTYANDATFEADNSGAPKRGNIYYNTTDNKVRYYDNTSWIELLDSAITASQITNVPAGNIAATDLQATVNELDIEKVSKAGDTISGNLVVTGNLDVQGTTTTVDTTNLEVADNNININNGGNDATSEGAGLNVERTGTDGSLIYEDALASKWKLGVVGSEKEIVDVSSTQTLTNKTLTTPSGLVKGDVGLVNVDNTSDSTKNSATVVLTNKDIDGGIASNTSRVTLPKDTTTNLDLLTDKQATIAYDTTLNTLVQNVGTGWTSVSGTSSLTYLSKTGDYTANTGEFIDGDVSGGAFTVTLPTAVGVSGEKVVVRRSDSSSNRILVDGNGAETINGIAQYNLYFQFDITTFISDGTNWMIKDEFKSKQLIESKSSLISYTISANQYGDLTSITLRTGTWDISVVAVTNNNGVMGSATNIEIGVSTTSGNSATGLVLGDNHVVNHLVSTVSTVKYTMGIPRYRVTPASSTIYYLKAMKPSSTTNLEIAYKITAKRVN